MVASLQCLHHKFWCLCVHGQIKQGETMLPKQHPVAFDADACPVEKKQADVGQGRVYSASQSLEKWPGW